MKYQDQTISGGKTFLAALYFLGFLEFSAAAVLILSIDPDPKNAVLLGYSLQRLALFALTISPGLGSLLLSGMVWRGQMAGALERFVQGKSVWLGMLALVLAFLALLIVVMPSAWMGSLSGYYRRIQPLLVTLCAFPAQLALAWLPRKSWQPDRHGLRCLLVFLVLGFAFWGIVLFSGLGITPEKEFTTGISWNNIAGTPLTMFQWLLAVLITLGVAALLTLWFKPSRAQPKWIDLCIALALYLVTVLVWAGTPLKDSTFASKLDWPYYQAFPLSDAAIHDMGALSILQGQGINFGAYTDKPIYMSFLAILHLFAGYNYNLLVFLQIGFLALIAPVLYYLGKSFHSRPAGILTVVVLMLRQRNAILLTNVLYYNAAPNLLMTEVPTLLGLLIVTGCWFAWMKKPRAWLALAAGGALGVSSLIRLNPVLILPAIPVFALLGQWGDKKRWLSHFLAYLLGFVLLITPWLFTGTNSSGQSYFLFKFFDIITVRYGVSAVPMEPIQQHLSQPVGLNSLPNSASEIDVNTFPGFVINNFMHNIVESFLVLPDSLSPSSQNLSDLEQRFYWKPETFERERIPYVVLNCFLVAVGLAWSWRRWRWTGMVPMLTFLGYSLSLALGRTSGSRYLVPIDWIFYFYYVIGVLTILRLFLPTSFLTVFQPEVEVAASERAHPAVLGVVLVMLIALAAVIPVADNLIPENASLCQPGDLSTIVARQSESEANSDFNLSKGIVLYPKVDKQVLTFDLFSCQQTTYVKMAAPFPVVKSGDIVIVGWPASDLSFDPLPISLLIPAN